MTHSISKPLILTTAIALFAPTATLADLSANEVWDSWKSYAESLGQTITVGSKKASGGALVLNDVKMVFEFPEGSGSTSMQLLEFRERGDGTVAITMAPDLPFSFSATPEEGEAVDMAMIWRQSGMSIIASGDPEDITFDYLASDFSFGIDTLIVDGEEIELTAEFSLSGINGQLAMNQTDGIAYSSKMKAADLSYNVAFTDPDGDGRMDMTGTVADLRTESDVVIPDGFDPADPAQIFSSGFEIVGNLAVGPTQSNVDMQDGDEGVTVVSTTEGSGLNFAIENGGLEYGGAVKGATYNIQSPQIPFPEVSLKFSEIAFNLLMPFSKSDDPSDYEFLMRIAGLEVNDMIWNMFDGGNVMPRDPATISLDLTGQMNWLVDISDPEQAEAFEGETPALLHNLTLNELLVSALGAEVNATGDFTFDNSDLETFDGLPAPTGKIDANIIGANGLMDRLTQMGFLPAEQAMGARMMLGLFARPAGGEDTLTSTIEVKGDGSVFANGMQIQ